MRIGVVGTRAAWSTECLAAALRKEGAAVAMVDLATCAVELPGGVRRAGQPLPPLDGVVVKKIGDTAGGFAIRERINVLRQIERDGVPVWSAPDRLETALDRYRMTLELAAAGLPIPETVVTDDLDQAEAAVVRFGAAVLKPLYTSKGRGMAKLVPDPTLRETLARHREADGGPFYLQRFVPHPGRDLGVAVLDGHVLGAYWRVSAGGAWMTTVRAGGRYVAADPPPEAMDLAVRAAKTFGLLFTGVDLVETPDGGFNVFEVSAFGGFRGLLDACGVDAASLVARAVIGRVLAGTA
jgi:ribosomal protein S6--L-glutamate ligase